MSNMENNAGLQSMLLDEKIRGRSYLEMEAKHGIPAIECRQIVREALNEHATKDPIEWRLLLSARIEKITDKLWDGLEDGSFKHGEAILKAVERLAELNDLNEKTITHETVYIQDGQVAKLLEVMEAFSAGMLQRMSNLPLNQKAQKELESGWPEWAAEVTTDAVEQVVYAELTED